MINHNIIHPYKGRTLNTTLPVRVFRNLNKKGVWYSIRQKGLTVAHAKTVCLIDAKFVVNQKTRERIVKTKKREVHAFIEGLVWDNLPNLNSSVKIEYNPFKFSSFTCTNTPEWFEVNDAMYVVCNDTGVQGLHLNLIGIK